MAKKDAKEVLKKAGFWDKEKKVINFKKSDLSLADFGKSDLSGSDMRNAKLRTVVIPKGCKIVPNKFDFLDCEKKED